MADNPYQQNNDQNPFREDDSLRSTNSAGPAQPSAPPAFPQQQKKSRTGLYVGCGVVGFFLLVLAFIGGIFYFVTSLMKSSDAYVEAMARARNNQAVIATIGEPISDGFFSTGSINLHNDDGSANLQIPISGPKGSGTVYVRATKTAGTWTYQDVHFNTSDNKTPVFLGPVAEQLPEKPQ